MEHSRSREGGEHLVCRITAHISSEVYRVKALLKEMEVSSVCVIDEQPCGVLPADSRKSRYIGKSSGIVGRCDVYA